jgi:multidrug efflux pump subunit AcrA (membrane-fusion protein)
MNLRPSRASDRTEPPAPVGGHPPDNPAIPAPRLPGSPSPLLRRAQRPARARRHPRGFQVTLVAGILLGIGGGSGAGWYYVANLLHAPSTNLVLYTAGYQKLQLTVVERGALESAENSDVICRVKAGTKGSTVATTIKWVIDDGSLVHRGQEVAELDSSGLEEQLKTQKISVDQDRSTWVQAEENYKIVVSQNESDIKSAGIAITLAQLDLDKFLHGDYLQTLKDIEGRTKIAESDLEMSRDRAAWADRMLRKGFYTASQTEAEHSRAESADIALKKVQEELRVLEDYTKKRTITDLESKLEEAKRALERVKLQAQAKEAAADIDRITKKSVYEQEAEHYREIEEEVTKGILLAPQDGLVVYYVSDQNRWGSGSQQSIVAQGEPVREGQRLMRIPNLNKMLVNTRVHEALVSRVRGESTRPTGFGETVRASLLITPDALVRLLGECGFAVLREDFRDQEVCVLVPGQPAQLRVDAFPERLLRAHVKSVATIASQQDWMSADVKVYQTLVALDEPLEGLRPGMSAEVTILVEDTAKEALTLPVQAILGTPAMGKSRKCFVMTQGRPQERDILVGLNNEKMAEIKSGLVAGEQVVLNPQTLLNEKEKAAFAALEQTALDKPGTEPHDPARDVQQTGHPESKR